jgi:hypothetical protein
MKQLKVGYVANSLKDYANERGYREYPIVIEVDGKEFNFEMIEGDKKIKLVVEK